MPNYKTVKHCNSGERRKDISELEKMAIKTHALYGMKYEDVSKRIGRDQSTVLKNLESKNTKRIPKRKKNLQVFLAESVLKSFETPLIHDC